MRTNISTNIIRDENKSLNYIVTKNAVEIFNSIFNHANENQNSFTIIGNYGTGKSTFLWAAEKNLKKETSYFDATFLVDKKYQFLKFIGENNSISSVLAKHLQIESTLHEDIMHTLEEKRKSIKTKNNEFIIIIDEFGKFLEYINKTGNSDDLYLIQLIAEWANDADKNVKFILTLHQDFSAYSTNLSQVEQNEWNKVKGRFKELLFNEPIEQLIYFASQSLNKYTISPALTKQFETLKSFIKTTQLFSFKEENFESLNENIYPLDWLSLHVLVNSIQKYGQNERSLFSFFSDNDLTDISFYTVDQVFDYLVKNLSSEITSLRNPHRLQWQITFRALERAELIFDAVDDYKIAEKLIKSISLLNLFSRPDTLLDKNLLKEYYHITLGIRSQRVEMILDQLTQAGIIRFYRHSKKLNFLEGTDLDIEQELVNVSKEVNSDFILEEEVKNIISLPVIPVKRYSFEKGSPRYFEFKILSNLNESSIATEALDGYINLIFNEKITGAKVKAHSKAIDSNLYVVFKQSNNIKNAVFNFHKLEYIRDKRKEDKTALLLIDKEIEFYKKQINQYILVDLFNADYENDWYIHGKKAIIRNSLELNQKLSEICSIVYASEPEFKNELVNKEYISTPIVTARKRLLKALLNDSTKEDLGFETDKFPPEKAIYLSLYKLEGIHRFNPELGYYELGAPTRIIANGNLNYGKLWEACDDFLSSSVSSRRNLSELFDLLKQAPFKLKKGFLELWVLSFLIIRKEDYSLFHEQNGFIPYIDEDILELIFKNPHHYSVKSYRLEGIKLNLLESYKELTQTNMIQGGAKSSFLTIYGNFLRFYNSLNDYAKKTKSLSAKAIAFRDAIFQAKDPEDALFNLFPQVLGFNQIDFEKNEEEFTTFIEHIQDAIREIRSSYDQLLDRIETQIIDSLECENKEFKTYKAEIVTRLNSIKPELLAKENGIFYRRLVSPIDDRESWLKSVADIALGKPINNMLDAEELILMNNLSLYARKLFEVSSLHEFKSNENRQMVSLTILNSEGNQMESKLIIDQSIEEEIASTKSNVVSIINKLDEKQRKQLLYSLLNEELNKN
ncbi:hypothetical protein OBJ92_06440 [Empedobacter falsenii]